MKTTWILSAACGSGLHCAACRASAEFQRRVNGAAFACPYGVGEDDGGFEISDLRGRRKPLTVEAKARRLWSELRRWRRAGYKLVDRAERERRLQLCAACPHYAARGNLGLGQCKLCGCTRAKLWLASARCPHPDGARWEAST